VGCIWNVHGPGDLRAQRDPNLRHLRQPDLHLDLHLGKLLVQWDAGMHPQRHQQRGLWKLRQRKPNLQFLRAVGRVWHLHRPGVLAWFDPDLQHLWQPDLLIELHLRELLVQRSGGMHAQRHQQRGLWKLRQRKPHLRRLRAVGRLWHVHWPGCMRVGRHPHHQQLRFVWQRDRNRHLLELVRLGRRCVQRLQPRRLDLLRTAPLGHPLRRHGTALQHHHLHLRKLQSDRVRFGHITMSVIARRSSRP
jgi:hypothetical protein